MCIYPYKFIHIKSGLYGIGRFAIMKGMKEVVEKSSNRSRKWLVIGLVVLLLVVFGAVWLGLYLAVGYKEPAVERGKNEIKQLTGDCGLDLHYPPGSQETQFVPCGYINTDDQKINAMFLGKLLSVEQADGKVFLRMDYGKGQEQVLLGKMGGLDKVYTTPIKGSFLSPYQSGEKPERKAVALDDAGVTQLGESVGKYLLVLAWLNSPATTALFNDNLDKLSSEDKSSVREKYAEIQRCGEYTDSVVKYYDNLDSHGNTTVQPQKNEPPCQLIGQNLNIYE